MNDDNLNINIDPPKISLADRLKYRMGYFQGKPRVVTTVVGVLLMSGISLFVAYASLNRSNVSLNPDTDTSAANPSCLLELTLKTPIPTPTPPTTPSPRPSPSPTPSPTPTPTRTPTPSPTPLAICDVSFDSYEETVCWPDPLTFAEIVTVNSLPNNPPYYLETSWVLSAPPGSNNHHYSKTVNEIRVGETYTIYPEWPGINFYSPRPAAIEIHVGAQVHDRNGLLQPNCTAGKDIYWTPFVNCPNLATPKPVITCSWYNKLLGRCK